MTESVYALGATFTSTSQMLNKYVTTGAKCVNFHSIGSNLIWKVEK